MKIEQVLMLAFGLCCGFMATAQGISLSLKDAPIETVFQEIQKQTDYRFVYTSEELDKSIKVSISTSRAKIEDVLKICFQNLPIDYTIEERFIVVKKRSQPSTSQRKPAPISGRILNEKGEPLAGASVTIKGSGISTPTNENGIFFFSDAPESAILIISNVGYEMQETRWKNESNFTVRMKLAVSKLEEIIINTGYQTLPKERSTGSYVKIDNQTYNEQVGTNVLNRLEPIVNGLTVYRKQNPSGQIMIRGLSTLRGPKDPLIVIDNFPYEGDINNINPNDIESITVLKDAAAASIWGTRAGNGVIVITTKKGKQGQALSIELNSNVSIGNQPDLFYLKNMTSGDFIDVEQFLFNNNYRLSDTGNSFTRPIFSPVYEILLKERSGRISSTDAQSQINALRNIDVRNEFNDYFYQKSINQQYSLSLQGGSANFAWILSGGYDRNTSELAAKYTRVNARFDNSITITKRLSASTGIYFTKANNQSGKPGYGDVSTNRGSIPPYTQFVDANGSPLPIAVKFRQAYLDTFGGEELLDWNYYPASDYKSVIKTNSSTDILANAGVKYKVTERLIAEVKYQYERQTGESGNLYDEESFFARDYINLYSQFDPFTGAVKRIIPKGGITDLSNTILEAHQARGQLTYSVSKGKHNITAIAGGELRQRKTSANGQRRYGYNPDILTSAALNYTTYYPTLIGFGGFIPTNLQLSEKVNRFVSTFANAAYTYDGRYTLSASGRRDASNIFGVNANNKWTPLWSTGASWEISNEKFYSFAFIDYLKLRLTYGYSGNIDPANTAVTTISYVETSPYTQTPLAQIDKFSNPDLRWERVRMFNAGIDFKSKNNRFSGSIEYYHKKAVDLFGPSPLDYTTGLGVNSIMRNVAGMEARGMDVLLNTINLNGALRWTTELNLNYYKDKITDYYQSSLQGSVYINGGAGIGGVEGKPVYSIYSYAWAGLEVGTGDPLGYSDHTVSKDYALLTESSTIDDLKFKGSAMPVLYGSIGNSFLYKNFSLSARLTYKLGYYFQKQSINYSQVFASSIGNSDYERRWQNPGDEKFTNVPSMIFPANESRDEFYNGSEVLIKKGDHIRFQYITMSYTLNQPGTNTGIVKKCTFYLNLNNLGIIWRSNKESIDPDYNYYSIPPSRTLSLGLRATF